MCLSCSRHYVPNENNIDVPHYENNKQGMKKKYDGRPTRGCSTRAKLHLIKTLMMRKFAVRLYNNDAIYNHTNAQNGQ